jgi:lipid II isoglutaminyl synthase (glutamine-hydrolysing)
VPDVAGALDSAVSHAATGRLFVLPTYTALLELRGELAARGQALPFWEPAAV